MTSMLAKVLKSKPPAQEERAPSFAARFAQRRPTQPTTLRVLVCGSRNWTDAATIGRMLDEVRPAVVIHGAARGADAIGGTEAWHRNAQVLAFPADWNTHGKAAGHIRNAQMLREGKPDLVLAFHEDPNLGKGTAHMVRISREAGVPVRVFIKDADGVVRERT